MGIENSFTMEADTKTGLLAIFPDLLILPKISLTEDTEEYLCCSDYIASEINKAIAELDETDKHHSYDTVEQFLDSLKSRAKSSCG